MRDYKKTLCSNIRGICVLVVFVSMSMHANSAEIEPKKAGKKESLNPYQKSFKVDLPKDVHFIYAGAGLSNKLLHVILEKPTQYGNFYTKVGQYNEGNGVAGLVGYRYPYMFTNQSKMLRPNKRNNNGVYVGVFGGHVMNIRDDKSDKDDKRFNRLGVGADISYLWFDASRIGALSLGMFVPERKKLSDGTVKEMKPEIMLSFSLSAGLF